MAHRAYPLSLFISLRILTSHTFDGRPRIVHINDSDLLQNYRIKACGFDENDVVRVTRLCCCNDQAIFGDFLSHFLINLDKFLSQILGKKFRKKDAFYQCIQRIHKMHKFSSSWVVCPHCCERNRSLFLIQCCAWIKCEVFLTNESRKVTLLDHP